MSESEERKPEEQRTDWNEKLSSRTADFLATSKETLDKVLKIAREEIVGTGDVSRSQAEKLRSFLRRDFATHSENLRKTGENIKKGINPKKLSVNLRSTFARSMRNVADKLEEAAEKSEKSIEFKTGEVAGPGVLTCKECGAEMNFDAEKRIPPCPKCHKTLFRISF